MEEKSKSKFILPTEKSGIALVNPRDLIIFSKPKTGKTTLFSELEDCLLLDLEKGSGYVSALKIEANSIEDLIEIGREMKGQKKIYTYVAIDTVTALLDICLPYAETLYMATPLGKTWETREMGKNVYGTILNLPKGAGYPYLWTAYTEVLKLIKGWAKWTIISAHSKDSLSDKTDNEFSSLDIALTGKLKQIACMKTDSIGYLFRKGNQNILTFKTSDDVACGSRCVHLRNKEIVISEEIDGKIVTYWDKIFINK